MSEYSQLIGATLAERYQLLETLGEGGAATVFLAHDARYDRRVAIKVLRPDVAESVGADRFQREIALAARLSHPHIVPLLDAGETNGVLFYVMPVISGNSLRSYLKRQHQIGVGEALRITHDVALALDCAHEQGVVHRDIKPENILLAGGTAVVTDFGIAKLLGESSTGDSLTRTGIAVGTVLYMSPEQASAGPVDARSDVYALGCLVYEMLAGEPPYLGPSPQSVLAKHFMDPIPQVRRLRDSIPAAIDEAIATAMAKSPGDRYTTAGAFSEALQRARGDGSTSGEPAVGAAAGRWSAVPTPGAAATTSAPPLVRQRWGLGARLGAGALVVALATATVALRDQLPFGASGGSSDATLQSIAVLPFDDLSQAKDQEYFATGMADELLTALSRLPDLRVAARTSSFALRRSDLSPSEIGKRLRVGALLTGSIRKDGSKLRVTAELMDLRGDSVLWNRQFDRELRDVFAVQEEIARAIAGQLQVLGAGDTRLVTAATHDEEAYQLYLQGRHAWRTRTAASLQRAVSFFQQAIARDPGYASAHAGLADTYTVIGLNFYGRPGENFRLARSAAQRAIALDSTNAEAHAALASTIAFLDRDWEKADAEYRRAIALDASYPATYYFYSIFLSSLSRHDSSLAMASKARQLDPASPVMAQGPGISHIMAGRFADAVRELEQAISVAPNYYFPHSWHGIALARTGSRDSALAEARRALALAPDNVLVRTFLGQTHALVGQRDSAIAIARALEAREAEQPIPNVMIARLYAILGDVPRAMAALERALPLNEAQLSQLRIPGFESLRGHPRYEAMLRELRLR